MTTTLRIVQECTSLRLYLSVDDRFVLTSWSVPAVQVICKEHAVLVRPLGKGQFCCEVDELFVKGYDKAFMDGPSSELPETFTKVQKDMSIFPYSTERLSKDPVPEYDQIRQWVIGLPRQKSFSSQDYPGYSGMSRNHRTKLGRFIRQCSSEGYCSLYREPVSNYPAIWIKQ